MDAFLNMPWDGQFLIWLQENVRSDVLTPIMKLITHLGDKGIFWILALSLVLLFFKKTRPLGMMAGIALVFSVLINNVLIKPNVGRIRPYEVVDGLKLLIERQHDPSFPSGHSGASFAAAVVFLVIALSMALSINKIKDDLVTSIPSTTKFIHDSLKQ